MVNGLVEVARFDRPYQADLARLFLESHGLHTVVFDSLSYVYSEGALTGIRLMSLAEDEAEARVLLRDYDT